MDVHTPPLLDLRPRAKVHSDAQGGPFVVLSLLNDAGMPDVSVHMRSQDLDAMIATLREARRTLHIRLATAHSSSADPVGGP